MFKAISSKWGEWKNTAAGKALEDFYWYMVALVGFVAVDGAIYYLSQNEASITAAIGPWGAIVLIGVMKSLSYLRDKLKDPRVPNTPV